jgi:hypothetical protein
MSSCNKPLNLCKDSLYPKEKFWMDDIKELYQNNNYIKFFPKYEMTRAGQLNAITRFCIYFILLILAFDKNENWLYLPITIIVLGVVVFNVNASDDQGKTKEFNKILKIRQEKKDDESRIDEIELSHDGDKKYNLDTDNKSYDEMGQQYELQSGSYDSNGVLRVGSKSNPSLYQPNNPESLLTIDEMIDHEKNTCRRPTVDNPFMNPNITEYNDTHTVAACNADDEEINEEMEVNFNHDLFRDVDELWERENSQRQFYTIPNTQVPNNQVEFAKWLYKLPPGSNCKEDASGGACLRYENLKSQRDPQIL